MRVGDRTRLRPCLECLSRRLAGPRAGLGRTWDKEIQDRVRYTGSRAGPALIVQPFSYYIHIVRRGSFRAAPAISKILTHIRHTTCDQFSLDCNLEGSHRAVCSVLARALGDRRGRAFQRRTVQYYVLKFLL